MELRCDALFVTVRWSWAGVVLLVQKYLLTSTKALAYCLGPVDSCLFFISVSLIVDRHVSCCKE